MKNKTILVSGASGNLGKAAVACFLEKGWNVAGLVHQSSTPPPVRSDRYHEFEIDLLDKKECSSCMENTIRIFGGIDAAVLTAGGFSMGNIKQTSIDDIELFIQLNFSTAYNLVRPLSEYFKDSGGGKFFFIGSGQGMDTTKGKSVVAYSLSKSLLFQLANIINADQKTTRTSALVIVPNTIDTPQNRKDMPDADFSKWQKPNDIAKIIVSHLSDKKLSNNGIIVVADELLYQKPLH